LGWIPTEKKERERKKQSRGINIFAKRTSTFATSPPHVVAIVQTIRSQINRRETIRSRAASARSDLIFNSNSIQIARRFPSISVRARPCSLFFLPRCGIKIHATAR